MVERIRLGSTLLGALLVAMLVGVSACRVKDPNAPPPKRWEMPPEECKERGGRYVTLYHGPDICLRPEIIIEP